MHNLSPEQPSAVLRYAARLAWLLTQISQLAFAFYLAGFYVLSTVLGKPETWAKNAMVPNSYQAGDSVGNTLFGAHVCAALLIMLCGLLQITPSIRRVLPKLHRISGRVYLSLGVLSALGGMALNAWHGATKLAISINAVLIVICAWQTYQHARKRNIAVHQRWALRAFVVISAVFFLRLGVFASFAIIGLFTDSPSDAMQENTFEFWTYASYVLPLLLLEWYWWAKRASSSWVQNLSACSFALIGAFAMLGLGVLWMMSWWPMIKIGVSLL
jgi:hypothetical protein